MDFLGGWEGSEGWREGEVMDDERGSTDVASEKRRKGDMGVGLG